MLISELKGGGFWGYNNLPAELTLEQKGSDFFYQFIFI